MEWGCTQFSILGLEYSVNLSKMVTINFANKSKNILINWRTRYFSPVGKISVIKTFILSLFNHLFISLPSPSKTFLEDLKTGIYSFIWDKKPEKVNRKQLCQSYPFGGLKMINIDNFIVALKCTKESDIRSWLYVVNIIKYKNP